MEDNLETTAMRPFEDGDRVAFFGDSITRNGEAVTRTVAHYRKAFPGRNVRFFNVGISGATVSAAHIFFENWLEPLRLTYVVLAFGVNDAGGAIVTGNADDVAAERRKADDVVARFEYEYERLIDRIQTLGAKVVLRTPTPYDGESPGRDATPFGRGTAQERMADSVRHIAQRRSIPLVDDHAFLCARLAAGEQLFGNDHVHPNEKGQWWLSENLLRAQGLEAGAFRSFAEVAAEAGLAAWHETAVALTYIPSTEWLIMHGEALPLDEQLAKARKWLEDNEGKDGTNPAIVRFAREYLRHKPREAELRTEEEKSFEMARGAEWPGFSRGMGIGGWLTNYKRFNVLPEDKRLIITEGDLEHFDSYITEADVANIASMGVDHIRLGFDQIVLEEVPGR